MKSTIQIISRKWSGRGEYTSVERFCHLLDPGFYGYHGAMTNLNQKLSVFLKRLSNSTTTPIGTAYNSGSVKLEWYGISHSISRRAQVLFYPYADFDYFYSGYVARFLMKKVVLWTYFSVYELKNRFNNLSHFERADLVLVAGKEQFEYLRINLRKPKLIYFPLGVDTQYFKPGNFYTKRQIIFSGANRRDFKTAINAFDIIYKEFLDLKVIFIGCNSVKNNIPQRDYLEICGYLEDAELLSLYQSSHIQVLTLLDGGSSNSLLEGYACGLPVICTKLPNIIDYLIDEEDVNLSPNDCDELAVKISNIFKDDNLRNILAKKSREKAKEFDWLKLKDNFSKEIELLLKN